MSFTETNIEQEKKAENSESQKEIAAKILAKH